MSRSRLESASGEGVGPFVRIVQRPLILMLVLWAITSLPAPLSAQVPGHWRWSNPRPHGANIHDQIQAFGRTLQFAERGQIFASDDLINWTPVTSGTDRTLRGASVFGSRLIITGEEGLILFTDDLKQFTPATLNPPTTDWLEGVAVSGSLLVAVGDNAAIYTSPDSVNWTRRTVGFSQWLRGVAFGGGRFVAVGENGFIATSTDGVNWSPLAGGSGTSVRLNRVRYFSSRFWAAGQGGVLLSSANGLEWTPVNTGATNDLFDVATNLLTKAAAGRETVRLEQSGAWSEQADGALAYPAPKWTYFDVLTGSGLYLLGGRSGMTVEGFRPDPMKPEFAWINRQPSFRDWLWEVQRLPDLFVTVGDLGTIATSIDGVRWSLEVVPESAINRVLLGVGGNEARGLVAAGSKGTLLYSPPGTVELVSTNTSGVVITNVVDSLGIIWEEAVNSITTNDLQAVAVLDERLFVAGGKGTVAYTDDGTNWNSVASSTSAFLSGLTTWPGGLVAVGSGGMILTSPDGLTWSPQTSGTAAWLYRVRFLNEQLWAVGANGTVVSSANAVDWSPASSGTDLWLNDITYFDPTQVTFASDCFGPASPLYVIVGSEGVVLTSPDGGTWSRLPSPTGKSLYSCAMNGGQLLAVGLEGSIIRRQLAPDCTPPAFIDFDTDPAFNLMLINGVTDQRFILDRSEFLDTWTELDQFEIQDAAGTILILAPKPTNAPPSEYLRARLVP
ncbi:MAG TPA: hypothetical protein VLD18_06455 [Verrucomicrobiae bacterium]|nr:hypothetical protein [Verrucomicrobiae bacterium]